MQLRGKPPEVSESDLYLLSVFNSLGVALDDMPYTPAFDDLCRRVSLEPLDVWRRLARLRKVGRLVDRD